MKNEQTLQKQTEENKSSRRKYIIAGIVFCIIAGCVYWVVTYNHVDYESRKASEAIIRQIAAKQLNKDPNKLTDEDFVKIDELIIESSGFADIKLLEKFTNLQKLIVSNKAQLAVNRIPRWKIILYKLGLIDLTNKLSVDLSPLANLPNLQTLETLNCRISHLEKLEKLKNLQTLLLFNAEVPDFKPLKELKNLQILNLSGTQVSELKPLKDLTNLRELYLTRTQVSDFELLKELKNLKKLEILRCPNITNRQVEDLQKALPNLKIIK